MMILRPTLALAKRLRLALPPSDVPVAAPYADWCAHGFTADRHRYVIVTNTHSLFSVVTHGAGITSEEAFIRRALSAIRELLVDSGRTFAWERHIAPATTSVRFARIADRRVMGSINEFIFTAKIFLIEDELSPFDVSAKINETPMSYLWTRDPKAVAPNDAFDVMGTGVGNT